MSVENGFSPEGLIKEVEPQLPIIEHKAYQEFDRKRSDWEGLSDEQKSEAVDQARYLIEQQNKWWQERPHHPKNNAYSWTATTNISAALLLEVAGQSEEATATLEQWRSNLYDQIRINVQPDGSSYDFQDRDSVHYHVFNEVAWLKASNYLRHHGEEIPADVSESLERSIAFAEPYLKGEKTHLEFVNSRNPRDAIRHPESVGQPYDPNGAKTKHSVEMLKREIDEFHSSKPRGF